MLWHKTDTVRAVIFSFVLSLFDAQIAKSLLRFETAMTMSAFGGKVDINRNAAKCLLLTQSGHSRDLQSHPFRHELVVY